MIKRSFLISSIFLLLLGMVQVPIVEGLTMHTNSSSSIDKIQLNTYPAPPGTGASGNWNITSAATFTGVQYEINTKLYINTNEPVKFYDSILLIHGPLWIAGGGHHLFDNVTIISTQISPYTGDLMSVSDGNVTIINSVLDGSQATDALGVIEVSGTNNTFNHNHVISASYDDGIDISSSKSNYSDNIIDAYDYGMYITGSDNQIYNNTVNSGGSGVVLSAATRNLVMQNNVYVSSGSGGNTAGVSTSYIYSSVSGYHYSSNNTVMNNTIISNSHGIKLKHSSGSRFGNNTIEAAMTGIFLDVSATKNNFTRNNITGTIIIQSSSDDNRLDQNRVSFMDDEISVDSSYRTTITNNLFTFDSSISPDKLFYFNYADNTTFSNNKIELGVDTDLYIVASPGSQINNNWFYCECTIQEYSDDFNSYSFLNNYLVDNVAPRITQKPTDKNVEQNFGDLPLIWDAKDAYAETYVIIRNGSALTLPAHWTSGKSITYTIQTNNYAPGVYIFAIRFNDTYGNSAYDQVMVTITANTPISSSSTTSNTTTTPTGSSNNNSSTDVGNFGLNLSFVPILVAIPLIPVIRKKININFKM